MLYIAYFLLGIGSGLIMWYIFETFVFTICELKNVLKMRLVKVNKDDKGFD